MHNLHLCVVRAATAKEAEEKVEQKISGWGDANNWRAICGSVSEDNEVHFSGDESYSPSRLGLTTVAKINAWFGKLIDEPYFMADECRKILGQLATQPEQVPLTSILSAQCYLNHLLQVGNVKTALRRNSTRRFLGGGLPPESEAKADVFRISFYGWDLSEVGITHLDRCDLSDENCGGKRYVVFVDMHS